MAAAGVQDVHEELPGEIDRAVVFEDLEPEGYCLGALCSDRDAASEGDRRRQTYKTTHNRFSLTLP